MRTRTGPAARRAGCAKVFEDRASGVRADRSGLRVAIDYAREGNVLITWKLDRLGRSLPHLIETAAARERRGIGGRVPRRGVGAVLLGGLIRRVRSPQRAG